ncbi:MAG: ATP-binding cassette domain-containing protein [Methylophilaceae bacterium]|nr:ATP-binding cassette domain-containing protein [Methylophilaceae bacterium]
MPIIEVNHVSKEYQLGQIQSLKTTALNQWRRLTGQPVEERAPFKALDDVNFSIEQGEVVGIIGHNGAGKSTMLKLLANISKPSRGSITVKGKVAPLIEVGAGLIGDLTGRENIYLNGAILGISKKEIERKFDEIVSFAELEEFIDTPIKRYSSGMSVRLGFAIATSVESDILIVDEVLAVGDLAFQQKCIERMEMLIKQKNRTVLIVGHNIRQLERICSRVILLDHGHVSQDGNPSDVCRTFFRESQERSFAKGANIGDEIRPQQGADLIRIKKIELLNDEGIEVEGTGLHEPLTVRLTFECDRLLIHPEIILGLHTPDFVHVLSVSNVLSEARPNLKAGINQVICRFSDIPLRPFTYGLRLAFIDQYRQMLWYAENIRPVLITSGQFDITKMPEIGLIDLPSAWQFN